MTYLLRNLVRYYHNANDCANACVCRPCSFLVDTISSRDWTVERDGHTVVVETTVVVCGTTTVEAGGVTMHEQALLIAELAKTLSGPGIGGRSRFLGDPATAVVKPIVSVEMLPTGKILGSYRERKVLRCSSSIRQEVCNRIEYGSELSPKSGSQHTTR